MPLLSLVFSLVERLPRRLLLEWVVDARGLAGDLPLAPDLADVRGLLLLVAVHRLRTDRLLSLLPLDEIMAFFNGFCDLDLDRSRSRRCDLDRPRRTGFGGPLPARPDFRWWLEDERFELLV